MGEEGEMETNDSGPPNWKRFFPTNNASKKNQNYDFYISSDEGIIFKKNNQTNPEIMLAMMSEAKARFFSDLIKGINFKEPLSEHISKGFDLEPDGSYKSEFLHGYRLDLLDTYNLDSRERSDISEKCEELLTNLISAANDGKLTGDWALHNLIYSLKYKRIVNVDLEGFLFYDPIPKWADVVQIESWLISIIQKSSRAKN